MFGASRIMKGVLEDIDRINDPDKYLKIDRNKKLKRLRRNNFIYNTKINKIMKISLFGKLKKLLKGTEVYICEKCGWQTQKTKTTDKLKENCKNCKEDCIQSAK